VVAVIVMDQAQGMWHKALSRRVSIRYLMVARAQWGRPRDVHQISLKSTVAKTTSSRLIVTMTATQTLVVRILNAKSGKMLVTKRA